MKNFLAVLGLITLLFYQSAGAAYLKIEPEDMENKIKKTGGVVFPIKNLTNRSVNAIFGWVYGYKDEKPYRFKLASNPHIAAVKISPGPHLPGKTARYWFRLPGFNMKMQKYGLVVHDASVSFDN